MLTIRGDLFGHVGLGMSERTALDIVEILTEKPQDYFSNDIGDCLGEIVNQISGNIATHSAQKHLKLIISPPAIYYKTGYPRLIENNEEGWEFNIKSELGVFYLLIFLKTNQNIIKHGQS
jgi:CheY-specific phosphatase CheX